jgi:hypothetical protein
VMVAVSEVPRIIHTLDGLLTAAFFVFIYGLFWYVHGRLVFELFGPGEMDQGPFEFLRVVRKQISTGGLWAATVAILASHAISFVFDFVRRGEYRWTTPRELVDEPFPRVILLQVTLIFSGLLVQMLELPVAALVVMVLLKIWMDLALYRAKERRAATRKWIEQASAQRDSSATAAATVPPGRT